VEEGGVDVVLSRGLQPLPDVEYVGVQHVHVRRKWMRRWRKAYNATALITFPWTAIHMGREDERDKDHVRDPE
jgi:hypothetical protein